MTNFGDTTMEVPLKRGLENSKFLIVLARYIEVLGYASKYEGKIKFDKIRGTKMGSPSKLNFSTIQARHM